MLSSIVVKYKNDDTKREYAFNLILDNSPECEVYVADCIAAETGRRFAVRLRKDATYKASGDVLWSEYGVRRVANSANIARQAKLNAYIDAVRKLQAAPEMSGMAAEVLIVLIGVPTDMQETVLASI